jgi:dihydrodipicolinate synthase/N-acetylneuraminate lyase
VRTEADSISGVVPVMPTPFVPGTEDVDPAALRELVDFAASVDLEAVCLPAYGSEYYKLTDEERLQVVEVAVAHAAGRFSVVAQCNHGAARVAAALARQNVASGADVVSFALPRQMPLGETDLLEYAAHICDAVDTPVLIQDWNPGGATIGASFCAELQRRCPNFRYVKLEEPRMALKVRAIREATGDRVGVFEGWGGLYTLELLPAGICGIMPGLAVSDFLAEVWRLEGSGDRAGAVAVFQQILPWLTFGLSDMEFFNLMEKRLLVRRGVLEHDTLRRPTLTPDADTLAYADLLGEALVEAAETLNATRSQASDR